VAQSQRAYRSRLTGVTLPAVMNWIDKQRASGEISERRSATT
jgi:hypothetical protein